MTTELIDFPRMGIVTEELIEHVEELLDKVRAEVHNFGAVNWGHLGIVDIEYRLSMRTGAKPECVVTIEEADPGARLAYWLTQQIDKERFPNTRIETDW